MVVQKNNIYGEQINPWVKRLTIFFALLVFKLYPQEEEKIFVVPAGADIRNLVFFEIPNFYGRNILRYVATNTHEGKKILEESKKARQRAFRVNIMPENAVSSCNNPREKMENAIHKLETSFSDIKAAQQRARYKNILYTSGMAILAAGIGFFAGRYLSHSETLYSDVQNIHNFLNSPKASTIHLTLL